MKKLLLASVLACLPVIGLADEGMWTVDNFPTALVAEKYDVSINDQWLTSAQLATTRLENGCTGSFGFANGLGHVVEIDKYRNLLPWTNQFLVP